MYKKNVKCNFSLKSERKTKKNLVGLIFFLTFAVIIAFSSIVVYCCNVIKCKFLLLY